MEEKLVYELKEWMNAVEDIGKEGMRIGDAEKDIQRRKLSYCIAREILVQCGQIQETAEELLKSMREVGNFIETQEDDPQKVKTLRR